MAADAPVLNPDVLEQIRRLGGEKLMRDLAEIFLENLPQRTLALDVAVENRDLAAVAKAIHSLRSSSASLGAGRAAAMAGELEKLASEGAESSLLAGIPALRREVEAAARALRGLVEETTP